MLVSSLNGLPPILAGAAQTEGIDFGYSLNGPIPPTQNFIYLTGTPTLTLIVVDLAGIDPDPQSRITTGPTIGTAPGPNGSGVTNAAVLWQISNAVVGAIYQFTVSCTTSTGDTAVDWVEQACLAAGPPNVTPGRPCFDGFLMFLRGFVGITPQQLPAYSPMIKGALDLACRIVNHALQAAGGEIYTLAVYNLGAHNIISYAQDPPGSPAAKGSDPPMPFFAWLRQKFGLNSFVGGVISAASDNGTAQSMEVPESLKNLTIQDLQTLKTPYGRTYLGLAQSYGTGWGLS